ncbi:hypothetical protein [Microbacterium aurantiacum]
MEVQTADEETTLANGERRELVGAEEVEQRSLTEDPRLLHDAV